MSVHTVEDNLRRVYGKLGIRSRTELAAKSRTVLPAPDLEDRALRARR
jgi:DNA-binding CsgD family transcriptional regulator